MHILILGNATDAHAAHLHTALTQGGATVAYFDTRLFPTHLCLSWDPQTSHGSLRLPGAGPLALQDIHSVFWRTLTGVGTVPLADAQQQRIASNDTMSALHTLINACPARWVNSWQAYQFHREKPRQLAAVHQLGVPIPPTLITNDPTEVRRFAQAQARVIFKPVYGGAHTRDLSPAHLASPRLELALQLAPITLQAYVPGTNMRSYVLGHTVYTVEIRSAALDFRDDRQAAVRPVALPAAVQEQCRAIAKTLFLTWTAIDWRVTPWGDYVFLEANPSPMFLHVERHTGFPITQDLVHLLMQ
jgi:glutathione synthase/RimK-type ligase-like ATP-grasp enzyme